MRAHAPLRVLPGWQPPDADVAKHRQPAAAAGERAQQLAAAAWQCNAAGVRAIERRALGAPQLTAVRQRDARQWPQQLASQQRQV